MGVILGIILLIMGGIYFLGKNICDNEFIGSYKSPNGMHEAVYTEKRCGAISEDVGYITLDEKEIVRARLGDLKTRWIDNKTLYVEYSGIKVSKLIEEYNGIHINFQHRAYTVAGMWVNSNGAELILDENGQFNARLLPREIFWRADQSGKLNGKGTWMIGERKSYQTVELYFHEVSGQPASLGIPIYISEDGDYLYQWAGEEGEKIYKLERK